MDKQKGLASFLIVILVAVVIGGYVIYQKQFKAIPVAQQTIQFTPVPISQTESTSSGETANWKIYKSSNLGFEMKYPDFLYPGLEKQENVAFGFGEKGGAPIPYLTITKTGFLDYKNLPLKKCLKYQGLEIEYCIEKSSNWGQEKDLSDIKLDKKDAKSFYVSDFTCKYHIVQTTGSPFIELRMCVSRGVPDDIFNQILSTFKFLDQNSTDTSSWKTYNGSGYAISYPPSWELDPSLKGLNKVIGEGGFVIISPDYQHNGGGYIEEGIIMKLFVDQKPFSGELGLESEEKTTWLEEQATLAVYKYEGNNLVLTTDIKGRSYQLVMSSSRDLKNTADRDIFLKVAASLRPSQ